MMHHLYPEEVKNIHIIRTFNAYISNRCPHCNRPLSYDVDGHIVCRHCQAATRRFITYWRKK